VREQRDVKKLWKLVRKDDPKTRLAAKGALVSIGAPAVPTLVRVLTEPNRALSEGGSLHNKARRILALMGERAVEPLREVARTGEADARGVANEWLAQFADFGTADLLEQSLIRGWRRDLSDATGPALEKAATALAARGDMAVGPIVARLRKDLLLTDRVVLVRSLASLAAAGSAQARSAVDGALSTLRYRRTLHAHYERFVKPGTVDPALREEINALYRQAGIQVSSAAYMTPLSGGWILEDADRRFSLTRGEVVETRVGSDEWQTVGHEYAVGLSKDDPLVASIRSMLKEDRSQLGPDTSAGKP